MHTRCRCSITSIGMSRVDASTHPDLTSHTFQPRLDHTHQHLTSHRPVHTPTPHLPHLQPLLDHVHWRHHRLVHDRCEHTAGARDEWVVARACIASQIFLGHLVHGKVERMRRPCARSDRAQAAVEA
eukprot:11679-Chlamydomonas_euryale.AAC.3